jgi:hypothetical protein
MMTGKPCFRTAALSAGIVVLCVLSSGCGPARQQAVSVTAAPVPSADSSADAPRSADLLQSSSEADMVRIFHFLIQLDAVRETSLNKNQAEAMLPIVRKSVKEGTLSEEEKRILVKQLRPEQAAVYTRWSERKEPTTPAHGKPGGESSGNEGDNRHMLEEWMEHALPEHSGSADENHTGPQGPDNPKDRPLKDDWTAGEKNVEQQLIDLLESKLK